MQATNNKTSEELNNPTTKWANIEPVSQEAMDLAKINELSLTEVKSDDVFTFKVAMCDNTIDRQLDRFSLKSLYEMSQMYVGKPLIKDHDMQSVDGQIGRIYDTEVKADSSEMTSHGEAYTQLIAHCYIANTEKNADLIQEIKLGIKKEVSVGFRQQGSTCSICGNDYYGDCRHMKGEEYNGVKAYTILDNVSDALELSLVAVPAQPRSGVTKSAKDEVDNSEFKAELREYLQLVDKDSQVKMLINLGYSTQDILNLTNQL